MTLKNLYKRAKERGAKILCRSDGNYRIQYPKGYKGNKQTSGITYVSGVKCYVCGIDCLQPWDCHRHSKKATCTRICMDSGMFHDMQDEHDNKKQWWDRHSNYKGYKMRKRKDPITGKTSRKYEYQYNFESHYGRPAKSGHHLHHINMHKRSDNVLNLIEVTPTRHQELHTTYNTLCKSLMDDGIVGFDSVQGYYRK